MWPIELGQNQRAIPGTTATFACCTKWLAYTSAVHPFSEISGNNTNVASDFKIEKPALPSNLEMPKWHQDNLFDFST